MSLRNNKLFWAVVLVTVISFAAVTVITYDAIHVFAAETSADISKNIYELETKLAEAEKEQQALEDGIASDREQAAGYAAEILRLDKEIEALANKLTLIEALNEQWNAQAEQTKLEISQLEARKEEEINAFESMLRLSYTHGSDTYFNLIFGSQDIGDFLSRADLIDYHQKANNNILNNLVATITSLETANAQYEESLIQLAGYSAQQEELQTELETRSKEAEAQKAKYEADEAVKKSLLDAKNQEMADMEAEMQAEVKRLEEKRKEEEAAKNNTNGQTSNNTGYSSGPFAMPLAKGTYRLSSGFVNRISPITGKPEKHNGLDLAAPGGTPIYAAQSGTVIVSRYSSSWGNVIQISHGGGVVTLYAHCSARLVSQGQTVEKGQLIGKVGTTGWSTGNHLHFTVYENGVAVDPRGEKYLNF